MDKRMEKHIERSFNELENVHLAPYGNEQSLDSRGGRDWAVGG